MYQLRKTEDRGQGSFGWLEARYTFSFSNYHDPDWMGFRNLVVMNQDVIDPDKGFATHAHKDMEILTYVIRGAIEHKDSEGNQGVIRPGEIQRMSAGSGIAHSEWNPSKEESTELLQIWIEPAKRNLPPSYEQKSVEAGFAASNRFKIAGQEGSEYGVQLNQDVTVYAARYLKDTTDQLTLSSGRHLWVQVVHGQVKVNEHELNAGDGLAASDIKEFEIMVTADSEVLLFDLK